MGRTGEAITVKRMLARTALGRLLGQKDSVNMYIYMYKTGVFSEVGRWMLLAQGIGVTCVGYPFFRLTAS